MSIAVKDFYKDYVEASKTEIEANKNEIIALLHIRNVYIKTISKSSTTLLTYYNIHIKDLKVVTKILPSSQSPVSFQLIPLHEESKLSVLNLLEKLININKSIKEIEVNTTEIKGSIISYKLYKFIQGTYNKLVVEEIIKGYVFNFGKRLSTLRIKKKDRDLTKEIVNWNASLQLKREIIARGGTPYKVLEKDSKNRILKDNGGEYYLVYNLEDYSYWWEWGKSKSTIPNRNLYTFMPTRGRHCVINKLHKYRKANPNITLKYFK